MAAAKDDAPEPKAEATDPSEPPPARRTKKATKAAAKPTPESIGIEGVVRVGGHRLDEEQGWVPDTEALPDEED